MFLLATMRTRATRFLEWNARFSRR
jgi:hypothetical protein